MNNMRPTAIPNKRKCSQCIGRGRIPIRIKIQELYECSRAEAVDDSLSCG
jgi:hypothetical protein